MPASSDCSQAQPHSGAGPGAEPVPGAERVFAITWSIGEVGTDEDPFIISIIAVV